MCTFPVSESRESSSVVFWTLLLSFTRHSFFTWRMNNEGFHSEGKFQQERNREEKHTQNKRQSSTNVKQKLNCFRSMFIEVDFLGQEVKLTRWGTAAQGCWGQALQLSQLCWYADRCRWSLMMQIKPAFENAELKKKKPSWGRYRFWLPIGTKRWTIYIGQLKVKDSWVMDVQEKLRQQ